MRFLASLSVLLITASTPSVFAESFQSRVEWALFNEILIIGIIVGIIVYALLFYAIVRFREKPHKEVAK